MPKKPDVSFSEKRKATAYFEAQELEVLHQGLNKENLELGLSPRDRRSNRAGKTLSDLLVTLSKVWMINTMVRQLVRQHWAPGIQAKPGRKPGAKEKK
ncbi:MAG TPA: hypothetical protein VMT55_01145 [Candidatus Sulfotelmatobacter sp.]|nr:hypothetical protein [Candidatus Sulfotelmatobacter sp.]